MSTQQRHESNSSTKQAARSEQLTRRRRLAHTNSARAGEEGARGEDNRAAGARKGPRRPQ
jgi:hypothetical protein